MITLKEARALAKNIVPIEGDQLEIDFDQIGFDLDRPQLSICPQCSSDIIKLADGCRICGWRENQFINEFDKCSSKKIHPSKIPPSKSRRRKGEGTGYIYRRTVTRKGIQYQESYYRYRDESAKLRSKYIRGRLLDRVEEAENSKLPIADVLRLLGGFEISRGEPESEIISRGELVNPPSTKKRKHGYGGGYIECKPITKNGNQYKQYWFHWEVWQEGDRVRKKSRYIPKRLVQKVERMNGEKVAVREILEVLGVKNE